MLNLHQYKMIKGAWTGHLDSPKPAGPCNLFNSDWRHARYPEMNLMADAEMLAACI